MTEYLASEIRRIAPGLQETRPGIWQNPDAGGLTGDESPPISYPEKGNAFCYELEETSYWFQHRNRCLKAVIREFPPDGLLLDVGGGNGFVTTALRQAGIASVVLEPGHEGIQNAQRRRLDPLIQSTLEEASIVAGSLPALGLFDVLEHIADDSGFLKQAFDVLEPGGRLYLTVPAFGILWSTADVDAGHYRRYTALSLSRHLHQAGFQVEYKTYLYISLWLPAMLLRALPSWLGWRKSGDLSNYQGELGQPNGVTGSILDKLLNLEASYINKLKYIPLGSSLLAVAHKPTNG